MVGFSLFGRFFLTGGLQAYRTRVGLYPSHLVRSPEKQEQNQGQADTPGQALDGTVTFPVVPDEKDQRGTEAVKNDENEYDDQDFDGHVCLDF
jgi:hypothetical protein